MTKHAIKQSIYYAKQELRIMENSGMTRKYIIKRHQIINFIHRMKKELRHAE